MPEVGRVYRTAARALSRESIAAFAREHDPQAMHLDEAGGAASVFGRVVASGWQTASVTMRLVVEADLFGGGSMVGLEVREMKFAGPVYPGDELRAEATVEGVRRAGGGERALARLSVRTLARSAGGDEREVLTQRWTVLGVSAACR